MCSLPVAATGMSRKKQSQRCAPSVSTAREHRNVMSVLLIRDSPDFNWTDGMHPEWKWDNGLKSDLQSLRRPSSFTWRLRERQDPIWVNSRRRCGQERCSPGAAMNNRQQMQEFIYSGSKRDANEVEMLTCFPPDWQPSSFSSAFVPVNTREHWRYC